MVREIDIESWQFIYVCVCMDFFTQLLAASPEKACLLCSYRLKNNHAPIGKDNKLMTDVLKKKKKILVVNEFNRPIPPLPSSLVN